MENQRIRLTKQLLKNALLDMLKETTIGKIKINTLCERAQINRTTFYKYYGSQYDLLKELENDFLNGITAHIGEKSKNDPYSNLIELFIYIENNRDICMTLINQEQNNSFAEKIFCLPELGYVDEEFKKISGYKDNWKYIQFFVYHGAYSILSSWINKEKRESPYEMVNILFDCLKRFFPDSL